MFGILLKLVFITTTFYYANSFISIFVEIVLSIAASIDFRFFIVANYKQGNLQKEHPVIKNS